MHAWRKAIAVVALLVTATMAQAQAPSTVLVVANANNSVSVSLANFYMNRHSIPTSNRLLLNWNANDNADTVSLADYSAKIAAPIYAKIAMLPRIDYIVLCRNLPVRINETTGSVDSALAAKSTAKCSNPYFGQSARFSSAQFGIYLVTRLDGWSWADAMNLVNRGIAKTQGGTFALDIDPKQTGSNLSYNTMMRMASTALQTTGCTTLLDTTANFLAPTVPLMGYISWGSNDHAFSAAAFATLRFAPGGIAETLVSTSASNLRYPGGWQSQIAQLIQQGVTGVKGYVSEPYVNATALASVLFPRYTAGYNLAESFYGASQFLGWKDVVVGDPLCAPYAP